MLKLGDHNRPYIMNALENSQSVIHPVTHENPHHAALITDGMYYTGALKSRQSLHMTSDLDPTEVKDHINNHPLKHLNKNGTDSGDPVDTIKGDVHINRTYGERYQWREGVDFNYGLNATYNVGQQYTENHADDSQDITQSYDIPGLDAAESSAAGNVDDAVQAGLAEERKAGLVTKNFGNQYKYDQGITRTWAAGPNASGEHSTINFGGRYIENQLTTTSGDPDSSGINGSVSDTTLAIKTVGDEARYNESVIDIHHEGDMKHIQTGAHTSEITGDVTETVTDNIKKDTTGDVTENVTGAAEAITKTNSGNQDYTATIGGNVTETSTIAGNYTVTLTAASVSENVTGNFLGTKSASNQTVLGACLDNFLGFKSSNSMAAVQESFLGAKVATHSGPIIENKQGQMIKNKLRVQDIASVCMDKSLTKIEKANLLLIG